MRQLGDGCDCHFFFFFPLTPSRSLPSWFHVSSIHCSTYLLRWVSSLFGKEQVGHKERHENTGSSSLRQTTRCFNPCSGHFWRAFTKHHQFAITLDILSYYRLSDTFFLLVSTSVYPPKKKRKGMQNYHYETDRASVASVGTPSTPKSLLPRRVPKRGQTDERSSTWRGIPQSATAGQLPDPVAYRRASRSSETWTSSSGDVGGYPDADELQDRGDFVREYNRLAAKVS